MRLYIRLMPRRPLRWHRPWPPGPATTTGPTRPAGAGWCSPGARRCRPSVGGCTWLLFILTLVTTTIAGAVLQGRPRSSDSWGLLRGHGSRSRATPGMPWRQRTAVLHPAGRDPARARAGPLRDGPALPLDVSPPYFLPVPLWPSFIGTMGAFIRLRTWLSDRRQLFDVGRGGADRGLRDRPAGAVDRNATLAPAATDRGDERHGAAGGHRPAAAGGFPCHPVGSLLAVTAISARSWCIPSLSSASRDVRHDDQPHADGPARRRAHPVRGAAALAPARGAGVLGAGARARVLVDRVVCVGRDWCSLCHGAGSITLTVLEAYRPLPRSRRRIAWLALALFLLTFAPVPFRI